MFLPHFNIKHTVIAAFSKQVVLKKEGCKIINDLEFCSKWTTGKLTRIAKYVRCLRHFSKHKSSFEINNTF